MAAVASAARQSANNSPHMNAKSITNSPRTTTRSSLQNSEVAKKDSSTANGSKSDTTANKQAEADNKGVSAPANAPLAPPPKPNQNGGQDYFSGTHNASNLTKEVNPFDDAFRNPAETPGKSQLPGITSLTSPASLLPNNTPGWPGSLRSGPLSPAMLAGPTGNTSDYFSSDHFGGSFPTPNESSLRTGLTPGGTGSMFPQPSPNSQALLQQLHAGGATPGTLDFHRTAMAARAQHNQTNTYNSAQNVASSLPAQNPNIQPDLDSKPYNPNNSSAHQDSHDPFGSHQTNDAANGLFMLAQAGGQRGSQSNFGAQQQSQSQQQSQQPQQAQSQQPPAYQPSAQEKRAAKVGSIGSNISANTEAHDGQFSDDQKPAAGRNGRGKKASATKPAPANKRKTEDTPVKNAATKKQRANSMVEPASEPEDEEMDDQDEIGADGRKMTDEEKRKNFLERNRVAALKCRQRKKQWLANLQHKVEVFTSENDALATTVTSLREEIVGLKTLLLAHKDCPVSQAQGISGMAMQQIAGTDSGHNFANPYGMAMNQGGPGMGQGQMHRR